MVNPIQPVAERPPAALNPAQLNPAQAAYGVRPGVNPIQQPQLQAAMLERQLAARRQAQLAVQQAAQQAAEQVNHRFQRASLPFNCTASIKPPFNRMTKRACERIRHGNAAEMRLFKSKPCSTLS